MQTPNATRAAAAVALLACASATTLALPENASVGFDGGDPSGFIGNAFFEAAGGNPNGNARFLLESFGIELRTGGLGEPSNPAFLGDYSSFDAVTFDLDVRVDSISFFGSEVPRDLGVTLIDRDIEGPSGASGVFLPLGVISSSLTGDWTNLAYTIDDPTQETLPAGVIGFGDEDPDTFEPILPDGATFATVLAGVDEVRFTTFVPGFFFGFTNFDVRFDNVRVTVPAPATTLLLGGVGLCAMRRRRAG